jgi:hypothetical protein
MARKIASGFIAIGGTALAIWLDKLDVPKWFWLGSALVAYFAAGIIAWWPRWQGAWRGFVGQQGAPVQNEAPTSKPVDQTVPLGAKNLCGL